VPRRRRYFSVLYRSCPEGRAAAVAWLRVAVGNAGGDLYGVAWRIGMSKSAVYRLVHAEQLWSDVEDARRARLVRQERTRLVLQGG
jgi:hypothetical protein